MSFADSKILDFPKLVLAIARLYRTFVCCAAIYGMYVLLTLGTGTVAKIIDAGLRTILAQSTGAWVSFQRSWDDSGFLSTLT